MNEASSWALIDKLVRLRADLKRAGEFSTRAHPMAAAWARSRLSAV